MNIQNPEIDLRPLSPYRCTDLGFALARQWYWHLLRLYLIVAAPALCLGMAASVYFPGASGWIAAVLWWFKPLAELALLFWCSKALFGEQQTALSVSLAAWRAFPRLLLNYLGAFRLSPVRGMGLCVVFLEQSRVGGARKRLDVLKGSGSALSWLLVVGAHIEFILTIGGSLLLYYFWPFQLPLTESFDQDWQQSLQSYFEGGLYSFAYLCATAAFAPFFVCASFVHYINRRSRLEAWDIQHAFNRLHQRQIGDESVQAMHKSKRGTGTSLSSLLVLLGMLTLQPLPADADTAVAQSVQAGAVTEDIAAADMTQQSIAELFQQERFGYYSDWGRLKFIESDAEEEASIIDWSWLKVPFELLKKVLQSSWLDVVLVLLIGALLLALLYQQRGRLRSWWGLLTAPRFPLEQSLEPIVLALPPSSFVDARRSLLSGELRGAIACCLRAVLLAAEQQGRVGILASDTESECLEKISAALAQPQQAAFTGLLQLWRDIAYAAKDVPLIYAEQVLALCEREFAVSQP